MRQLRVGITSDYIDKQLTGIGIYTKYLIENLIMINDLDIYLIHYKKNYNTDIYDTAKEILVNQIPIPPAKILTNILKFPSVLKNIDLDLVHVLAPNPSDNLSYFYLKNINKILTIHDLYTFLFPAMSGMNSLKNFGNFKIFCYEKLWVYSLKKIINKVDRIIADSENTKKDIIKLLKVPEEKIRVIPLAHNDDIFRPMKHPEISHFTDSFILSEDSEPVAIEAYYKLKKRGIREKLVMFGISSEYRKQLDKLLTKFNLKNDVKLLGHIPNEKLPELYSAAKLFIFIHSYEGFGIPPLEAMACGCPVLASNVASIPEVVGDAGILVNPHNPDEQAETMYEVLINEGLRQAMIKKGLERSKMFSWKRTARETYNVYKEVLNDRPIH